MNIADVVIVSVTINSVMNALALCVWSIINTRNKYNKSEINMIKIEDNKLIVKCEIFKDGAFHSNYETKFDCSGKYFDGENYNFKRIHDYILSQFDFEPSTTYFSELDLTRNTLK